jgi:hypothetical protein
VHCKYGFQSDTLVVSVVGRHIVYAGYTRKGSSSYERIKNAKIHRVMNKKNPKHVTVLLSNQKAPKRYTLILLELFLIAHSVFSKVYLNISVFCFIICGHVGDHKTSLTSPFFIIVVSVPTQDDERSYIMVTILPLFLRVSDSIVVVFHLMKMISFCVIIYPY